MMKKSKVGDKRSRHIEKKMGSKSKDNWRKIRESTGLDIIKSEGLLSSSKSKKNDTFMYLPITKVDEEERMVYGTITKEGLDNQDEIVEYEATKEALPEFKKWRNLREMHQPKAVGTIPEITCDDVHKQVDVGAHVVDDGAWEKVKQGVYKGFSIGGKAINRVKEFNADLNKTISRVREYALNEVSLVDRPAHPECIFTMAKRDSSIDPLVKDIDFNIGKLENLRKKILTDKQIKELPNRSFALVRRIRKNSGRIEEKRFLPIPDKAHAKAVLKQFMNFDINRKERAIIHKNVKRVLGKSHKPHECPFCTPLYYELAKRGGDTLMLDRNKLAKARRMLDDMAEDLEGAIGIDNEEVVDSEDQGEAPHKSYRHDKGSKFEGSNYEDVEGADEDYDEDYEGDDDEDYEGVSYNDVEGYGDTSDELGPDEDRTHLADTAGEKRSNATSPDGEDAAGEDAEGAEACPYCGTTLKLLAEGTLSKARCPGCSTLYKIHEDPTVVINKRNPRGRRVSKSANELEQVLEKMVDLNEELIDQNEVLVKRIELLESTPRKSSRVERPNGAEEVEKADVELKADMVKAQKLVDLSKRGQELTPEQQDFITTTLNKSLDSKIVT